METSPLKLVPDIAAAPPPSPECRNVLDLYLQGQLARLTGGISPIAMALALAFQDWLQHLAVSPGKCGELAAFAAGARADAGPPPDPAQDSRFAKDAWRQWPFAQYAQGFMRIEQFWRQATSGVCGVSPHHADGGLHGAAAARHVSAAAPRS